MSAATLSRLSRGYWHPNARAYRHGLLAVRQDLDGEIRTYRREADGGIVREAIPVDGYVLDWRGLSAHRALLTLNVCSCQFDVKLLTRLGTHNDVWVLSGHSHLIHAQTAFYDVLTGIEDSGRLPKGRCIRSVGH